jgi:NADH-quinone oxidoreductase subunit E
MAPKMIWTDKEQQKIDEAIDVFKDEPGSLIPALQKVQALFGHLPLEAMEHISKVLRIPLAEIFGVATFYAQFAFEPKGRHTILSCQGTACHVRGGATVLEEMKRVLDVDEGGTTQDGRFTLEKVYCVGCCSLSPAIIINETAYGKLVPGTTKKILARYT